MTNKEKAKELAHFILYDKSFESMDRNTYDKCMEMAQWKDERAKSCFILISKLIKDGIITRDNPEHIMVEQMIELYNNLKI